MTRPTGVGLPAGGVDAELALARVLPLLTLIAGSGACLGSLMLWLADTGTFRPWAALLHAAMALLGLYWVRRPPARAYAASLFVTAYLGAMIGTYAIDNGSTVSLINLGLLSLACFYLYVDLRVLFAAQTYLLGWVLLMFASFPPDEQRSLILIHMLLLIIGGIGVYLSRTRALQQLIDTQQLLRLETEERMRAQERAASAQKLESLGVMAGGVAHDFNNLLVGIVGGVDLARQAGDDRAELEEALDVIAQSADAAGALCRDLLQFAGGRALEYDTLSVNALCLEARDLAQLRLPELVVNCDFAEDLAPVRGDSAQLCQALVNLMVNAGEAAGGERAVVTLSTRQHREWLAIRVQDQGVGIPPEHQGRVFDPFFSTKFPGRGLGLAIVAAVIRAHGGDIVLLPSETGALFEISLPGCEPGQPPLPARPPPGEWQGRGTVLLVDDDPSVVKVVTRLLANLGFVVVTARNGSEALAVFERAPDAFRLVIVDATMPGLDGPQTVRALRAVRADLPAVLSSGFISDLEEQLEPLPAVTFLPKPYSASELQAKLREALDTGVNSRRC